MTVQAFRIYYQKTASSRIQTIKYYKLTDIVSVPIKWSLWHYEKHVHIINRAHERGSSACKSLKGKLNK